MEEMHFGEHITIDGYGGDPALLDSEAGVLAALTDLCKEQGMTPLADPIVVKAEDNQLKDPGGWSGFLMIKESHISIHTFPRRRFVSADLYTCKNGLHKEEVIAFFKDRFRLESVESNFIKRGLEYPQHNLV